MAMKETPSKCFIALTLCDILDDMETKKTRGRTRRWIQSRAAKGYYIVKELRFENMQGFSDMFRMNCRRSQYTHLLWYNSFVAWPLLVLFTLAISRPSCARRLIENNDKTFENVIQNCWIQQVGLAAQTVPTCWIQHVKTICSRLYI